MVRYAVEIGISEADIELWNVLYRKIRGCDSNYAIASVEEEDNQNICPS